MNSVSRFWSRFWFVPAMSASLIALQGCKKMDPAGPIDPSAATSTVTPTIECFPIVIPSPSPTFAPSGNYLTGTISYTGSFGPVDSTHEIFVALWRSGKCWVQIADFMAVTVNGGGYTLQAPTAGAYDLAMIYDADGTLTLCSPELGAPNQVYNGLCHLPASALTISGPVSMNLSFDDSCRIPGIAGTLNYTGSLGPVNNCHIVSVIFYSDPGYTVFSGSIGGSFSQFTHLDLFNAVGAVYYVRAFYDFNGDTCGPLAGGWNCIGSGDPYIDLGPVPTAYIPTLTINLDDSQRWP